MSLLVCTKLKKIYPGGKKAVDGIDLHVDPGEIVGLLGPNGAGKTTTFRMACGLITPTSGRVMLRQTDVTMWPLYRRARNGMGYLPQDDSCFKKLSVEQNLFAILEYMGIPRKERMRRASDLLDQFGLIEKRKQMAGTLSGGERRRLEISRCLASRPDLILLDEPFTGIDPVTIHGIQDIIRQLRDRGISILLTDHRERETLTITDRSYIVCAGQGHRIRRCGNGALRPHGTKAVLRRTLRPQLDHRREGSVQQQSPGGMSISTASGAPQLAQASRGNRNRQATWRIRLKKNPCLKPATSAT